VRAFCLVTGRGFNASSGARKEAKPTKRDRKLQILPPQPNSSIDNTQKARHKRAFGISARQNREAMKPLHTSGRHALGFPEPFDGRLQRCIGNMDQSDIGIGHIRNQEDRAGDGQSADEQN
jgi:hypothetical protein